MKRTIMTIAAAAALSLTVPACGGGAGGGKAEKAAAIAKKIKANPDGAEATLKEAGMTAEQYEKLLREVAEDPELSEAYAKAMGN